MERQQATLISKLLANASQKLIILVSFACLLVCLEVLKGIESSGCAIETWRGVLITVCDSRAYILEKVSDCNFQSFISSSADSTPSAGMLIISREAE